MGFPGLAEALDRRRVEALYRRRRTVTGPQGPVLTVDGRRLLAFCSNDYLGLANHPAVVSAFRAAAAEHGVGAGASHLVCGHHALHQALEEAMADWLGRPRALLFSTGYMANLGVITALLGPGDTVLEDRLNHASLLDAGLLSGARFRRYRHNDPAHLASRLKRTDPDRRTLVVTDGVFSMDGDSADLPVLAATARDHGAWLMVDDAHGLGVLGETGAGVCEHFGLSVDAVPVLMGTLGKALGTAGAVVAGSETLIETLIQQARPYIYTTAMPPAVAAATLAGLHVLRDEPERRERLHRCIRQFRTGAAERDLPLRASDTAIQPVMVGEAATALRASEALEARGLLVTAIRPPTVPAGSARLRVTLSAEHRPEQVEQLLDALVEVLA